MITTKDLFKSLCCLLVGFTAVWASEIIRGSCDRKSCSVLLQKSIEDDKLTTTHSAHVVQPTVGDLELNVPWAKCAWLGYWCGRGFYNEHIVTADEAGNQPVLDSTGNYILCKPSGDC
ncbi:hypothetical protein E5Q_03292 [Mixia osmundae IAM 14324]|uniref:Secreted protein n=1 Tax=Mixia osmundae (strain CBS 9802 / IAM 14324 / JCM 22182 / KY 12970) TaxID=764103 RepID=G7E1B2_MIXOS|nr:hypothetical protein E5Q_03292 [Mixia osmundae IAM 14324]